MVFVCLGHFGFNIRTFVEEQAHSAFERFAKNVENAAKRRDGARGDDIGLLFQSDIFGTIMRNGDIPEFERFNY